MSFVSKACSNSFNVIIDSICQGTSYNFNGNYLLSPGIYNDTLYSVGLCDSIIELHLIASSGQIPKRDIFDTLCAYNSSINFYGQSINKAGIFKKYGVHGANGTCDSIITLHVHSKVIINDIGYRNICTGHSYDFNGYPITQSGQFYNTLHGTNGCDSVVTVYVNVLPPVISTKQFSGVICPSGTFTFLGKTYHSVGTYTDTIHGTQWDTICTLNLYPPSHIFTATIRSCNVQYNFNGNVVTTWGTYLDTLKSRDGCDSILKATIEFGIPRVVEEIYICTERFPFLHHGILYKKEGKYIDTIKSTIGCDSILELTLHELYNTGGGDFFNICPNDTFYFRDTFFLGAGAYKYVIKGSGDTMPNHCNLIYFVNLGNYENYNRPKITKLGDGILQVNILSTDNVYNWLRNDSFWFQTFSPQLFISSKGSYKVVITNTHGCQDTSEDLDVDSIDFSPQGHANLFAVFPNPNKGEFYLRSAETLRGTFKIFDMYGNEILEQAYIGPVQQYTLPGYTTGVYIVVLETDGNTQHFAKLMEIIK